MLPKKSYGFGSCSLTYLIRAWSLLLLVVTTRAISNIRDSCVSRSFSKHMEMRYHLYVIWSDGKLLLFGTYQLTKQTADVLTKPLSKTKFEYFRDKLGVVENAPLAEREC